jgi:phosphohistidine swiveling domain-containing protein
MVSVSVAPLLVSPIVTPENGLTGASEVVVWPATVPVMVGATAGSLSMTVVALLTVAMA